MLLQNLATPRPATVLLTFKDLLTRTKDLLRFLLIAESLPESTTLMKGTILHATCDDGAGGWKETSIDTNPYIANYDGRMSCFGLEGV
ncbi:hypothetical protein POX_a01471 [Penicillium oxalicum]|uniref:hypothetical protein n=1 Tax=Penicillium oxalicum TaxID=69781 RepID=UPI0020B67422|nr:hypothetical protein POX_a01471 [Penicillium oxalicum]KAI2794870.1 hypothetical protein POX_a01471 [Penicillium oxalicum]